MSALSTLRIVTKWLFHHKNQKHNKYQGHGHPIIGSAVTISVFILFCEVLDKYFKNPDQFSLSLQTRILTGISLLLYIFGVFTIRYAQTGSVVLYELMWACNVSLITAAYALFRNRPLILAATFATISVDQVLWYVDLGSYLIFKKFPIGVAKYLTWPQTSQLRKWTSIHHILFIPLCFALLWDKKELPKNSWIMSCFLTLSLGVCSRIFAPHSIDTGKELIYLNLNLSRELWKDIQFKLISSFGDGSPWYVGIPFGNILWNAGDLITFSFLDLIFRNIK